MTVPQNDEDAKSFELLKRRYASIAYVYDGFKSYYNDVRMDGFMLVHAIRSWQIDEKRHVKYHPIENHLRKYKHAAYFMYWFIRLKPIQVNLTSIHDNACRANEHFALLYALNMLDIPINAINKELKENIIYTLHYRNYSPEALFITFELLQKCSLK